MQFIPNRRILLRVDQVMHLSRVYLQIIEIAMLILKYLQMKSSFGWSLSNLAALLRQQLFIFRDLWAWLNNPLHGPPAARQLAEQLPMPLIW
jgi:hypothetical protein